MDIRGIWKVKEAHVPTPEGVRIFTPDSPPTEDRFDGFTEMMQYLTEFADGGILNTLMRVPEEMKEEAAKHGVEVRDDGYAVIEATEWKEENGKYFYDTKIEGEVRTDFVRRYLPRCGEACFLTRRCRIAEISPEDRTFDGGKYSEYR